MCRISVSVFVTYGGSVLPYEPEVVAEEGQNTDAEHSRHKKKKQDMEFGVSVWQLILGKRREKRRARQESITNSHRAYSRRATAIRDSW